MIVGNAWSPNTVEPAFKYGGKTKPPRRENQNESFGGQQAFNLCMDSGGVEWRSIIRLAFRNCKRRGILCLIKILDIHIMAGGR